MGLIQSSIRFLAREHLRRPLHGRILTLGRQFVYATIPELEAILREEGIEPCEVQEGGTNIPAWIGTPNERYASDVALFQLLGASSVEALDVSDFEGADIIHDLNHPVPEALHGRFDVILDFGTSEHIFDVRQAFRNYALMLRPEGRILHSLPANNQVNHGFYQFSPTFFLDFYGTNGFADLEAYLLTHDHRTHERERHELFRFPERPQPILMTSEEQMSVFFVARKTATSTCDRVPLQGYYRDLFADEPPPAASEAAAEAPAAAPIPRALRLLHEVRRRLPKRLRKAWKLLAREAPPVDPTRKPWGLDLWTRL